MFWEDFVCPDAGQEENERADFDWGRTADPLPAEREPKRRGAL
nr:hypothetical protein [uncultured Clostridium sp.]